MFYGFADIMYVLYVGGSINDNDLDMVIANVGSICHEVMYEYDLAIYFIMLWQLLYYPIFVLLFQ